MKRLLAGLLALLWVSAVSAHPLDYTRLTVELDPDGTWRAELRTDLTSLLGSAEAYSRMAQAAGEVDPAREALIEALAAGFRFEFDGAAAAVEFESLTFPDLDLEGFADYWTRKLTLFRFQGLIPGDPEHFQLRVVEELPVRYPVVLTARRLADGFGRTRWQDHGERSQPLALAPPVADPGSGIPSTAVADPFVTVIGHYIVQGFLHILPFGPDHLVFVLALFLYGSKWRPLLIQVTGFTLAHSLTLGLALYGWVDLPVRWVESLIGLSIAWVGVENVLAARRMRAGVVTLDTSRRFWIVFGFGLLHGMGFAGALLDLELDRGEFLPALLGFNVGVELGQLAVLLLAAAALGWARSRPSYPVRVVIPGSLLIAAMGAYWTLDRLLFW